jgi:hypothetical protein
MGDSRAILIPLTISNTTLSVFELKMVNVFVTQPREYYLKGKAQYS